MKRSCLEYNHSSKTDFNFGFQNYSLRHLKYIPFIEKIKSNITNNNFIECNSSDLNNFNSLSHRYSDRYSNRNLDENDNSVIEITNDEYKEKINSIIFTLCYEIFNNYSLNINPNNKNKIDALFSKYVTNFEGYQVIELGKLIEEVRNSLHIEMNQIEIFCLYSRFKITDDNNANGTEIIDYDLFKKELMICRENQQKVKFNYLQISSKVINEELVKKGDAKKDFDEHRQGKNENQKEIEKKKKTRKEKKNRNRFFRW